jgi:hypothetical protein
MNNRTAVSRFDGITDVTVTMPLEHPLLMKYLPLCRTLDPIGQQVATAIILSAPESGADPAANAEHLNGSPLQAGILGSLASYAVGQARPLVDEAVDDATEAVEALEDGREAAAEREQLPTEIVKLDGVAVTRGQLPIIATENNADASRAEAAGDTRHKQRQHPGPKALVVTLLLTAIEIGVYAYTTMPTDVFSLLQLLGLIGIMFVVNHWGVQFAGRSLRKYLDLQRVSEEAQNGGWRQLHHGDRAVGLRWLSRTTPATQRRLAFATAIGWLGVVAISSAALVVLLAIRMFHLASLADFPTPFPLLFAVLFGAAVAIGLGLLVAWFTAGSLLGRRITATNALLEETDERRTDAEARIRESLERSAACSLEATTKLAEADDVATSIVERGQEGFGAAAVVLRVPSLEQPDFGSVIRPAQPIRGEVARILLTAADGRKALEQRLAAPVLAKVGALVDPHADTHRAYPGGVDLALVEPALSNGLVATTAKAAKPRRWWIIPAAVLAAVVLGVGTLLLGGLLGVGAQAAPTVPAEGLAGTAVDSRWALLGGTPENPVRWSCATPIEVGFAGPIPNGAADLLQSSIADVAGASGLPLVYVDTATASAPLDITVQYGTSEQVRTLGSSEDAVGVTESNRLGTTLTTATITIDGSAAVNDPANPGAALVMLHELGHAVGLAHVDASDEVMQPSVELTLDGLGNGDRHGLELVGCD